MNVRTIGQFKTGSDQKRFGPLEFLGGLEFSSVDSRLQSLSSIRFRADGESFVSVTDTGNWLTGRIERDGQGHLSNLADVEIHPILLRGGRPGWKLTSDAEGLALRNGQAVVSFEQQHRVDIYRNPGFETSEPSRGLDFLIPARELRRNAGMETIVASPQSSHLKGSLVIVAERSLDEKGNLLAAILEGPMKGQFTVVRHDPYDATDGAFLPNGDLLLLERRFSFLGGLGMRIRRIKGDSLVPGAMVDGEVLVEADLSYAIDNIEGLDVLAGADGRQRLILISDDNGSLMQRNVMLEFRLND
ncbi:hypothetical protein E2F50_17095 [Rhizobium deserti]|uniref:Phytase-like domain-containing protein n=1 Tax=Rhizobium deserti TaxID=2547961 RepID=A0A4R5UG99_9HYPH|nr:esterase-like activity of phytase family protein [Rhizobium deserti]TDK34552.1 hypothetical protein E2F50_17095 [Rhizobium deserti]